MRIACRIWSSLFGVAGVVVASRWETQLAWCAIHVCIVVGSNSSLWVFLALGGVG